MSKMASVLFVSMLFCLLLGVNTEFDKYNNVHKDNVFLKTAHGYARAKGLQSCWVCGLMPSSAQVYPYIAIPFTTIEIYQAYGHIHDASVKSPFYTVPLTNNTPSTIELFYAPRGVICWRNAGKGKIVGESQCSHYVTVGQEFVSVAVPHTVLHVPLPPVAKMQNVTTDAMPALNGTMFVCGSTAYSFLPPAWHGSCYLAYVVPAVKIMTTNDLKNKISPRPKRDLFHSHEIVATPTQRFFSSLVPAYGMTVALDEIRSLAHTVDEVANDTAKGMRDMSHE